MFLVFKKDRYIFRLFLIVMTVILLLTTLGIWQIHKLFNTVHLKTIEKNQQMVGALGRIYPESEKEIASVFINEPSLEDLEKGKEILKKYGYDSNLSISNDDSFNWIYNDLLSRLNLFLILSIIAFCLGLMIIISFIMKKIDGFSIGIEKIIDGNFSMRLPTEGDGTLGRLGYQFNVMARRLHLSIKEIKKEKEKLKGIVTDVSHQLKTPLTSLKTFNTLLLDGESENPEIRTEFLQRSEEQIEQLEWLVLSLVQISRLEAGMLQIKPFNHSISETLEHSIDAVKLLAEEKNIKIDIKELINTNIIHDPKWTKEAIFNILENAIKYTNNNGNINIFMNEDDIMVRIYILDNGIGISQRDLNHIFERFYRSRSKEVQKNQGSGIGLYLCKRIIEEQYGIIDVSSILGKGTEFIITFPKHLSI